jgi:hypothetical protein
LVLHFAHFGASFCEQHFGEGFHHKGFSTLVVKVSVTGAFSTLLVKETNTPPASRRSLRLGFKGLV